jgi:hypothetical protein
MRAARAGRSRAASARRLKGARGIIAA